MSDSRLEDARKNLQRINEYLESKKIGDNQYDIDENELEKLEYEQIQYELVLGIH